MVHLHTTMSFDAANEARRKEPKLLLRRKSYQQEPKRPIKLRFRFEAEGLAANSSTHR